MRFVKFGVKRGMAITNDRTFDAIYATYAGLVRATIYKLCGGTELDDLVQEAFVKIWRGLDNFRGDSQVKTWVYRVAYNVAVDYLRQPARKMAATSDESPTMVQLASASHEEAYLYRDLVQKGLLALTIDQRAVLVLQILQGLSLEQVAEVLEIPLGTVKSRLFTARQAMWDFLQLHGVKL